MSLGLNLAPKCGRQVTPVSSKAAALFQNPIFSSQGLEEVFLTATAGETAVCKLMLEVSYVATKAILSKTQAKSDYYFLHNLAQLKESEKASRNL